MPHTNRPTPNPVDSALFFLAKPRILHALPGRVRVHLPFLKRWGRDFEDACSLMARLLSTPDEIDDVSPCIVTGNVLIRYEAERLSQADLMAFLSSVLKIVIAHRDDWPKAQTLERDALERRLCDWLRGSLSHRLHLDSRLRIPADVFD